MGLALKKFPFALVFFSVLYAAFLYQQYIDIFFEAQFLHIDFLVDLQNKNFLANHFFTTFGEHLFPGYNIVLFFNYYLAKIDSWFELLINLIVLTVSAFIINKNISNKYKNHLLSVCIYLILLSTTLNPASGMALSASIGVLFFIIYASYIKSKIFQNNNLFNYYLSFFLIFISCNLFLGGYSIGLYSSFLACLIIYYLKNNKVNKFFIINSLLIILSLLIYIILVDKYGGLRANSPDIKLVSGVSFIQFILGMGGASLLGKSLYESIQLTTPYYFYGLLLYMAGIFFLVKIIKSELTKLDYFLISLFFYSASNIFFVGLFRYRNGIDGSFGQWYNVHTHFIIVFDLYYLFIYTGRGASFFKKVIYQFLIIIIMIGALAGYYFDWKKAKYIPAWKSQFIDQVPSLLLGLGEATHSPSLYESMLWDYTASKKGVVFLYKNHLSIFKEKKPLIFGITEGSPFISGQKVALICPFGTKNINFELSDDDSSDGLNLNEQKLETNLGHHLHFTINTPGYFSYIPNGVSPIVYFNYLKPADDPQYLRLRLKNFSCDDLVLHPK